MEELEELKRQKKEIEDKIKAIQNNTVTFGRAKLDCQHYPTTRTDEWYVAYAVNHVDYVDYERYRSIIRGNDKQKVIDEIQNVIADLSGLRDKLKGENT